MDYMKQNTLLMFMHYERLQLLPTLWVWDMILTWPTGSLSLGKSTRYFTRGKGLIPNLTKGNKQDQIGCDLVFQLINTDDVTHKRGTTLA